MISTDLNQPTREEKKRDTKQLDGGQRERVLHKLCYETESHPLFIYFLPCFTLSSWANSNEEASNDFI